MALCPHGGVEGLPPTFLAITLMEPLFETDEDANTTAT